MRFVITLLFIFVSAPSIATINKCIKEDGTVMFTDSQCPPGTTREGVDVLNEPQVDWVDLVITKNITPVVITGIQQNESGIYISYEFSQTSYSTEFMKRVYDLSNQTTRLVDFVAPADGNPGKAQILVSDKPLSSKSTASADQN